MASLRLLIGLSLGCLALVASGAGADDLPVNEIAGYATGEAASASPRGLTGFFSSRTPYEFWLTVLIIGFGVLTLTIVLATFRKSVRIHADQLLRFATVLIIVVGTLVLITAGYNNEQVAPAFGLFGTIVGYILGRMSQPPAPVPEPAEPPPDKPAPVVRA